MSIQDAGHEIVGLDLVICSEYLTGVSLSKDLLLCKDTSEFSDKKDLISSYRNCRAADQHMTLERYFYEGSIQKYSYIDLMTKK